MKNLGINIIHFLGDLLIGFSKFLSGLRTVLLMMLTMFIVMGVFAVTLIGFFDLVTPGMNTFGKTYWDIIAVVLGGSTMWFGVTKLFEDNKQPEKTTNFKDNCNKFT